MKGDCRVSRGGGEYVQTCIKYAPLTMIGHRAVVYNIIMLILFMYTYVVYVYTCIYTYGIKI